MRAEHVGSDTLLARVVQLVAEAQRTRAPVQRVADAVAAWFVPAVIAVAASAVVLWLWLGPEPRLAHGVFAAISVLIVACPCALGLATPMSISVASGRGARAGVLFRSAAALERLREVDVLLVDRTRPGWETDDRWLAPTYPGLLYCGHFFLTVDFEDKLLTAPQWCAFAPSRGRFLRRR